MLIRVFEVSSRLSLKSFCRFERDMYARRSSSSCSSISRLGRMLLPLIDHSSKSVIVSMMHSRIDFITTFGGGVGVCTFDVFDFDVLRFVTPLLELLEPGFDRPAVTVFGESSRPDANYGVTSLPDVSFEVGSRSEVSCKFESPFRRLLFKWILPSVMLRIDD